VGSGSGDTVSCESEQFNRCTDLVINFSAVCGKESVEVHWIAVEDSLFGYCVQYQCYTDNQCVFEEENQVHLK